MSQEGLKKRLTEIGVTLSPPQVLGRQRASQSAHNDVRDKRPERETSGGKKKGVAKKTEVGNGGPQVTAGEKTHGHKEKKPVREFNRAV